MRKKYKKKSSENYHFYGREKSLFIALTCFRNAHKQTAEFFLTRLNYHPFILSHKCNIEPMNHTCVRFFSNFCPSTLIVGSRWNLLSLRRF